MEAPKKAGSEQVGGSLRNWMKPVGILLGGNSNASRWTVRTETGLVRRPRSPKPSGMDAWIPGPNRSNTFKDHVWFWTTLAFRGE